MYLFDTATVIFLTQFVNASASFLEKLHLLCRLAARSISKLQGNCCCKACNHDPNTQHHPTSWPSFKLALVSQSSNAIQVAQVTRLACALEMQSAPHHDHLCSDIGNCFVTLRCWRQPICGFDVTNVWAVVKQQLG